mmetsp:Transcript_45820/g.106467  ORF Transcript_45820/g.106467 Transcript_45820/m.106467 type:complete len:491 (+) Transcript_45820:72-1544(+)
MQFAFGLAQQPLLVAAFAALCGVCLIILSTLLPAGIPTGEAHVRAQREAAQRQRATLYEDLRRYGLTGTVDVADFEDGFGLAATRHLNAGDIIMRVPGSMALSTNRTPSCRLAHATRDCKLENTISKAVQKRDLSRKCGLLALLVLEQLRGRIKVLERPWLSDMLEVLLEQPGEQTSNIFTVDDDEFRLLSVGTSMESWRQTALAETKLTFEFVRDELQGAGEVTIDMVQHAYLFLHSFSQWSSPPAVDDDLDLPEDIVVFLWPLFLARPTPSFEHGVQIAFDGATDEYIVRTSSAMRPGQEVHFVDWRLSDATALCFSGLWLSGRHRAKLSLDVSSLLRDVGTQTVLAEYGCSSQPLSLYVQSDRGVDRRFLACMRLLSLATDGKKLQRALDQGWTRTWPDTLPLSHRDEGKAIELGIASLLQALGRLRSSSTDIKQHFGTDPVAERPTLKVREAETMLILGLLKSLKELQLVVSDGNLYEAFVQEMRV